MKEKDNWILAVKILVILIVPPLILLYILSQDAVAGWTAVLGYFTLLVAIAAVGDEWVRHLIGIRPILRLTLNRPEGELANYSVVGEQWARFYHLRVSNERKPVPAINVRVVIKDILKPNSKGEWVSEHLSGWLTLQWQPGQLDKDAVTATIGQHLICDFGRIDKNSDRFQLTPRFAVSPFSGFILAHQKMRVIVQAVTDIYESNELCLEIYWKGEWSDDATTMSELLKIYPV